MCRNTLTSTIIIMHCTVHYSLATSTDTTLNAKIKDNSKISSKQLNCKGWNLKCVKHTTAAATIILHK